ncbi:MAG: SDR family oxidoreductase [Nibricoccus sp.]
MSLRQEAISNPSTACPVLPILNLLAGQKALVTGSSSGIGQAVAIALAQAGADVAINYAHDEQGARATEDEARHAGVRTMVIGADVSQEAEVQGMFRRVIESWGTVDIVVTNAGVQHDAALVDMSLEQWRKVIDINLTGQFLCAREAVREFLRRGVRTDVSCSAGKIICMSSVHEEIPWAGHVNYAASKGGVAMMMKSIAQEVAPHRIRVNSIAPGAIKTPINEPAWSTPEAYASLMKLIPYQRIGEPAEIGRIAAWLASDHSDYVTGATLFVDGGMTLFPGFAHGG